MTWEPTNELRFIIRQAPAGPIENVHTVTFERTERVLQQKWVWRLGDAVKVEWRDVPEVTEPTP